ncbi:retinitis pigmentosa 1-like 1 protein [Salvia splendens]|uniref:retinitis pigmentosa 1-like 1 protein n=1 Tax=Salvia splendens TaxID=180675 RepID=UPI001C255EB4|nr:retinitis pigmentosa 1-like 1 protein [Salvia splendens]
MIRSLNKEVDPASVLAQIEATPPPPASMQQIHSIPPSTSDPEISETNSEGTLELNEAEREGEMRIVEAVEQGEEVDQHRVTADREKEETKMNTEEHGAEGVATMEAEQTLLTTEEVERKLALTMSEAKRMELDVDAQDFERGMEMNKEENPTERVETSPAEGIATSITALDRREVVIVTDEEDNTEKVLPGDEAARPKAAAVLTYQRRPAREETSGKRCEGEQLRETPRQRIRENVDSPARSAAGASQHRMRLLIDEEPEEKDDVIFAPTDAQPSSEKPEPLAEVEENERERRKRKIKGKAIAIPVKKKGRRPAREETSGKRSEGEQPRETPRQRVSENVDSPVRSAVGASHHRRRLLIDEEPEEEDDVIFTPTDVQPSSGESEPLAEVEESERESRERKIKGKAIAIPMKKKPRQASSTLVIREERQEADEDEALRLVRSSKRRHYGVRSATERGPEMTGVHFERMHVRLDNNLLGRMITFDDPQTTKECAARVESSKKARSGRQLHQLALEKLQGVGEFM